MDLNHAFGVLVSLGVTFAVAAATAQDEAPSQNGKPKNKPADIARPVDVLTSTRISADADPFQQSEDVNPSAHPRYSTEHLEITTDTPNPSISPYLPDALRGQLIRRALTVPDNDTNALIRQLQAADSDTQRAGIKAKLSKTLGQQFDARQARHEREIKALEAQVKKLKDLVQKRQENREEIIARRLDQIVRESQGLGF
jgi:hypothetical protein